MLAPKVGKRERPGAAQACARVMQPVSSIINVSSVLGLTTAGLPQAAYSASKAAIVGLTQDLVQQ